MKRAWEIIGARMRLARRQRRMSLKDLAGRIGCSISYLSELECGRRRPAYGTAELLAQQFGPDLNENPPGVDAWELEVLDTDEICAGYGVVPPDVVKLLTTDPARFREVRETYRPGRTKNELPE